MEPRGGEEYLWERLKWVREVMLRVSTRDLEQMLLRVGHEVSHVTIGRYESGDEKRRRMPGADYITAFCAATDLSPEWILTGTGQRTRSSGPDPATVAITDALTRIRELAEHLASDYGLPDPTALASDGGPPTSPAGGDAVDLMRQADGLLEEEPEDEGDSPRAGGE